jgi:hypothetical protein
MTLKTIYKELGIDHPHSYFAIFTNWHRQVLDLKEKGYSVTPLRIGAKRVALAVEQEQFRARNIPWLIAALIAAAITLLVFGVNLVPVTPKIPETQPACSRLAPGFPLKHFGDWEFSNTIVQSLGNLSKYSTVATCHDQKWTGYMLMSENAVGQVIKKLTLTK